MDETSSPFSDYPVVELEKEREQNQTQPTEENNPIIIKEANGIREEAEKHITEQKPFTVWVADFAPADPLEAVKGDMRYFPVEWRIDEAGMSGAFRIHSLQYLRLGRGICSFCVVPYRNI